MDLWALGIHLAGALGLVAVLLGLSHFAGERPWRTKGEGAAESEPYESGELPTGVAGHDVSISFYVVALLFLLFDIEALYLLAWAPVAREVGWLGMVEVAVFTSVLGVALVYLWRGGVLDWGTRLSSFVRDERQGRGHS